MSKSFKKTILLDLDGVLNTYTGNYDENFIPKIKDGAKEFLQKLHQTGEYKLCLFTTRNLLLSAKWLIENEIDSYFYDITNIKIPAYLVIDDRTVCFNGDYDTTIKQLKEFSAWWKK